VLPHPEIPGRRLPPHSVTGIYSPLLAERRKVPPPPTGNYLHLYPYPSGVTLGWERAPKVLQTHATA